MQVWEKMTLTLTPDEAQTFRDTCEQLNRSQRKTVMMAVNLLREQVWFCALKKGVGNASV